MISQFSQVTAAGGGGASYSTSIWVGAFIPIRKKNEPPNEWVARSTATKEYFEVYQGGNTGSAKIYTITSVNFQFGKTIETQGTTGSKPISYITALALMQGGFKIHLDHRFVDVQAKIESWKAKAEDNELYRFYIGSKQVGKLPFIVESVKVDNLVVSGKGKILSADLDVSIQEYAGGKETIGILRKRIEDFADGTTVVGSFEEAQELYEEEIFKGKPTSGGQSGIRGGGGGAR